MNDGRRILNVIKRMLEFYILHIYFITKIFNINFNYWNSLTKHLVNILVYLYFLFPVKIITKMN